MQNIFVHETSIVDQNVKIGEGTKIWQLLEKIVLLAKMSILAVM